jgi:tRNA 2-thiouridine synthesizing protein A
MADVNLDLKGLKCPLPALKTEKTLASLQPGDRLTVECTDPMADIDIPHLLQKTGDRLVTTEHGEGRLVFRIEKV